MRILHLLASPWFTGPAETMLLLAQAQRALGHQVEVAMDSLRSDTPAEEPAAPHLARLGFRSPLALELSTASSPLGMGRDILALRGAPADVVHCHFSHDHALVRLARPAATVVRSIHKPGALRWSTPRAHAWTVSDDRLARRLLGQRVAVLPALVAPHFAPSQDRPGLRARLGLPEGRLVGMISTFQASRRHDVGLQAMAQLARHHADLHLILLGDGGLADALRAQVRALGLEGRVRFAGYKSGQDFAHHLAALDEVWVLGLGNDFGGRAAAQARACGVRVVAVDEGALSRYADATVEPSPASVAAAALGPRGHGAVSESADAVARRICRLYEEASS